MLDTDGPAPSASAADSQDGRADEPALPGVRTIVDLARIANVAPSTISRALAGKSGVKPETRDRIRRLAVDHGFCLNTFAQNLRAGQGKPSLRAKRGIASHVVSPGEAFARELLNLIFNEATRHGFDCAVRIVPGPENNPCRLIELGQSDLAASVKSVALPLSRIRLTLETFDESAGVARPHGHSSPPNGASVRR